MYKQFLAFVILLCCFVSYGNLITEIVIDYKLEQIWRRDKLVIELKYDAA